MSAPYVESVASGTEAASEPPTSDAIRRDRPLSLIAEAVLDDHTELLAAAARLRAFSSACRYPDGDELIARARLLEEFGDLLFLHFAAEEAEEFVGSLTTDEPSRLERIERVQDEHGAMVEEFDRLLELARSRPESDELSEPIEHFLDWLDTHEREENSIMQELILLYEVSETS
jgi:hemerythrin